MKRMLIITLFLSMFSALLKAPDYPNMVILQSEAINPYERIISAVTFIESGNGKYLLNEKEMAVGWFGIRPVRLNDYNKKTGKAITLDQCYDYEIGRTIFLYYASQFNPDDTRGICISWNGKSIYNKYYAKIQKELIKANL